MKTKYPHHYLVGSILRKKGNKVYGYGQVLIIAIINKRKMLLFENPELMVM
jgi:hypothetical protein